MQDACVLLCLFFYGGVAAQTSVEYANRTNNPLNRAASFNTHIYFKLIFFGSYNHSNHFQSRLTSPLAKAWESVPRFSPLSGNRNIRLLTTATRRSRRYSPVPI